MYVRFSLRDMLNVIWVDTYAESIILVFSWNGSYETRLEVSRHVTHADREYLREPTPTTVYVPGGYSLKQVFAVC